MVDATFYTASVQNIARDGMSRPMRRFCCQSPQNVAREPIFRIDATFAGAAGAPALTWSRHWRRTLPSLKCRR
jgi:hypothetical protein